MLPRHPAGVIARFARTADVGPQAVDATGGRNSNFADEGGAPITIAAHAGQSLIDERAGNEINVGICFEREARPIPRKRAACPAPPTVGRFGEQLLRLFCRRRIVVFVHQLSPFSALRNERAMPHPHKGPIDRPHDIHARQNEDDVRDSPRSWEQPRFSLSGACKRLLGRFRSARLHRSILRAAAPPALPALVPVRGFSSHLHQGQAVHDSARRPLSYACFNRSWVILDPKTGKIMRIRVGCELSFEFPQATPLIATLNVHFSRVSDLERPDHLRTAPAVPIEGYRDSFGNWCNRLVAPAGRFTLGTDTVVRDIGQPETAKPDLLQHQISATAERNAAISAREPLLRD